MKTINCANCGSADIKKFNAALFRCNHCGSLLKNLENLADITTIGNISEAKQNPTPDLKTYSSDQSGWRKDYEMRRLQNAGILTDFIVDKDGILTKYTGKDEHVDIPDGVRGIDNGVFRAFWLEDNQQFLCSVTIPDTVTTIGEECFERCKKLHTVNLPYGLQAIGKRAFKECISLRSITLPDTLVSLDREVFYESGLTSIKIPDNITVLRNGVLNGCKDLNHVTLPKTLKTIEYGAFAWSGITTIDLPDTLEHIADGAFRLSKLQSIVIPESVLYVSEEAFDKCKITIQLPKLLTQNTLGRATSAQNKQTPSKGDKYSILSYAITGGLFFIWLAVRTSDNFNIWHTFAFIAAAITVQLGFNALKSKKAKTADTKPDTKPDTEPTSAKDSATQVKCTICNGSGKVNGTKDTPFGRVDAVCECSACNGSGKQERNSRPSNSRKGIHIHPERAANWHQDWAQGNELPIYNIETQEK